MLGYVLQEHPLIWRRKKERTGDDDGEDDNDDDGDSLQMMGPNGQPLAPFMSPSGIAQQHTALHPALPAPESGQEPPAPAALATGAVQPRPVGLPGLSMPRPPTPLRPPLRHPGMPLAGRPSTAAPGKGVVPGCAYCCSCPRLCVLLFASQVVCVAVHVQGCACCSCPRLCMLLFTSLVVHVAVHVPGCACCCSHPRLRVLLFTS